ncbi:MAG: hypothetical protein ACRD2A_18405 [Vicinamibacterales bacterium]
MYLINALLPSAREMMVVTQARDLRQREIVLEYDVSAAWFTRMAWALAGLVVVGGLIAVRRG